MSGTDNPVFLVLQKAHMATLSSVGIGSGLDIKSIVSQLVALEKQPLNALKVSATTVNTKISAFGQIKSLVSTLADAATKLTSVTGWNAVSATSSDSSYVSVSAVGGTQPTVFNVEVQTLAKAKSTASAAITTGTAVGAGTLSLTVGTGTPVDITVAATDSVTDIASAINGAGAGVTATVLTDASGDRLLLSSTSTGIASGFTLAVTSDADLNTTDALGLSRLVVGSTTTQAAVDAAATVNGIAVTSSTNTFASTVLGVTFKALKLTTTPIEISIAKDTSAVTNNIDAFVKAYNEINSILGDATKYDADTKTAGLLQGDSTAVNLQNSLRRAVQAVTTGSSKYSRLADVGITQQVGGNLAVDTTKLASAMNNMDELKNMFRATGTGSANGVAVQLKALTTNLLSVDGFFTTKNSSLKLSLDRNTKDQTAVNARATRLEASLNARYSALDAQMASLTALNAYVAQQVTTWNKSTG
jgi:flagellar hook-associated protein 2